jgi:hypothetical protein
MKLLVAYLFAFATSVSAFGSAIVLNNSTSTIYAWSVGGSIGDRQTIVSGDDIQNCFPALYLPPQAAYT